MVYFCLEHLDLITIRAPTIFGDDYKHFFIKFEFLFTYLFEWKK